jgi:hypothetical protein
MGNAQKQSYIKKKESVVHIDGKDFKVISYFEGTETASKLIYDMATARVLNEPIIANDSHGVQHD